MQKDNCLVLDIERFLVGLEIWKRKLNTTKKGLLRWSSNKFKAKKMELEKLNSHLGISKETGRQMVQKLGLSRNL